MLLQLSGGQNSGHPLFVRRYADMLADPSHTRFRENSMKHLTKNVRRDARITQDNVQTYPNNRIIPPSQANLMAAVSVGARYKISDEGGLCGVQTHSVNNMVS